MKSIASLRDTLKFAFQRANNAYDTPKLSSEDINILNIFITSNDIVAEIKSLPKRKVKDQMDSWLSSTKLLRKS